MEERRKYPRFTVNVEVHWKKIAGAVEKTSHRISFSKDVSAGGISHILHPGVVAGDTLELEIVLPGKKIIRSKARVAWVDPEARIKGWSQTVYDGGLEFLDMSDADRKEIGHFLTNSFDYGSHK